MRVKYYGNDDTGYGEGLEFLKELSFIFRMTTEDILGIS